MASPQTFVERVRENEGIAQHHRKIVGKPEPSPLGWEGGFNCPACIKTSAEDSEEQLFSA